MQPEANWRADCKGWHAARRTLLLLACRRRRQRNPQSPPASAAPPRFTRRLKASQCGRTVVGGPQGGSRRSSPGRKQEAPTSCFGRRGEGSSLRAAP